MNEKQVAHIREQFLWYETDDLLKIWEAHDTHEWTDEAFEAIRQILITRVEELPSYEKTETAKSNLEEARLLYEENEFEKALCVCEQVLQSLPNLSEAHFLRGMILDEMDRLEEAVASLHTAIRLDPSASPARNYLRQVNDDLVVKNLSAEDRILAAFSHGSVILLPHGILVPAIIWIVERKKSKFLAYQCLQALVFQVANFLYLTGGVFLFVTLGFITSTITKSLPIDPNDQKWLFLGVVLVCFCPLMLFIIYGVIGTIYTLLGKNFHYAAIGKLVDRFYLKTELEREPVSQG